MIICGDFNIDLFKSDRNTNYKEFENELYISGLYPLITKPTRATKTSATLLDNISTCPLMLDKNIKEYKPWLTRGTWLRRKIICIKYF